jgi:hypothetical protein
VRRYECCQNDGLCCWINGRRKGIILRNIPWRRATVNGWRTGIVFPPINDRGEQVSQRCAVGGVCQDDCVWDKRCPRTEA